MNSIMQVELAKWIIFVIPLPGKKERKYRNKDLGISCTLEASQPKLLLFSDCIPGWIPYDLVLKGEQKKFWLCQSSQKRNMKF